MHLRPTAPEPDTERRRVPWRKVRDFRANPQSMGYDGLAIALPFAIGGLLGVLNNLGLIWPDRFMAEAGSWMPSALFGAFFVFGLFLTYHCHRHGQIDRRRQTQIDRGFDTAWHRDYPWSVHVAEDDRLHVAIKRLLLGLLLMMMLAPTGAYLPQFLSIAFGANGNVSREAHALFIVGGLFATPILLLFSVILLWALSTGVRQLIDRWRLGPVRLRFDTFPFFLGRSVRGKLIGLPPLRQLTITLRCLHEHYERNQSSNSGYRRQVVHHLWSQTYELEDFDRFDLTQGVELDLPLPVDDSLSSDLNNPNHVPRYWELYLEGGSRWRRFRTALLLPVYPEPN